MDKYLKGVSRAMSEHKKVIHVKDLVIKADNVVIEPTQHQHRRDPFRLGPRQRMEEEYNHKKDEKIEDEENSESDEKRPPFSWL